MRNALIAPVLTVLAVPALAAGPDLEMWRLDCGTIEVRDLDFFSDSYAYQGQSRTLTSSCYLIRHGQDYLLWDAGLPAATLGAATQPDGPIGPGLDRLLTDQLAQIGVDPAAIGRLGISHYHFDHIGQAASFPAATLMIGAADWTALKDGNAAFSDPALVQPWLDGGKVQPVTGDLDVFGDGSVTMLTMPGHTPGEYALLVRLAQSGPVLLSGDVAHFHEQLDQDRVPPFNLDRADSLAAMARLRQVAAHTDATLIIQHDADHIARLPAFPASAR
ncbi:N-acyl homoserine lactonase family protein [Paracoccus sp. M683]|uniref:N-acyl homoserine lactonase family protein n=1 Tax=Paracoccus sp. M683 TaxID=2594268 RepID=UPI001180A0E8|nr:N-acyl homoserine lactonase family protein [Paracoccus sp. M683]TRW97504.1 N-acyl homoserine lactonase family protein [Paracoccus sp. M683]